MLAALKDPDANTRYANLKFLDLDPEVASIVELADDRNGLTLLQS